MTKFKYSIIETEQNTTPKYKQNKIQTWQNAKFPNTNMTKYKRTKYKFPKYKWSRRQIEQNAKIPKNKHDKRKKKKIQISKI